MREITVRDFFKIKEHADTYLLDIREDFEVQLASIGGNHIPMGQLQEHLTQLPRDRDIYIICHHGIRSFHVCHYLQSLGLDNVVNIIGGIDAWSREVDPQLPIY